MSHHNMQHPQQQPNPNMRMQLMPNQGQQMMPQNPQSYGQQMPPPPPHQQQMMIQHQMGAPRSPGPRHPQNPMHNQQQQIPPGSHMNHQMGPGSHHQQNQMHPPYNQQGQPQQHPHMHMYPPHQQQHPPHHMLNSNQNSLPVHMQPEFRIYEMNKRLASRPEQDINEGLWWDSFANEFFDDEAKLSIRNVIDENVPKNFTISRTLIPRFFRSIYEGGVTDLHFNLSRGGNTNILKMEPNNPASNTNLVVFESDICTMTTKYGKPMYAIIFTEGHLVVEFSQQNEQAQFQMNEPSIKIRNWIFSIRRHQELVPRSTIAIQQDQAGIETLSKNLTKAGLANHTLNYLKLCTILEPMQEVMVRNKMTGATPRECLKQNVAQKSMNRMNPAAMNANPHQRMAANEEFIKAEKTAPPPPPPTADARTPNKRRKRKLSGSSSATAETGTTPKKDSKSKKANAEAKAAAAASLKNNHSQQGAPQQQHSMFMMNPGGPQMQLNADVMVVGEPSLMGGDFGEEDERLITRLENNQADMNSNNMPQSNRIQNQSNIQINDIDKQLQFQMQQQIPNNQQYPIQQQQQQMPQFPNLSISPPIQLDNITSIQQQPTRPQSLQSHLSQPNNTSSVQLPPRPQSTSSQIVSSSQNILETAAQQLNNSVQIPSIRNTTPSPSSSLVDPSNNSIMANNANSNIPITSPLTAAASALKSPNSLLNQSPFNSATSSNVASSSVPNTSNDLTDINLTAETTHLVNNNNNNNSNNTNNSNNNSTSGNNSSSSNNNSQPSTSFSAIASSSATSPNIFTTNQQSSSTASNQANCSPPLLSSTTTTNNNNSNPTNGNNTSKTSDVQQNQSISLTNYS